MGRSVKDLEYVLRVVLGFECEDAKDHVRFVLKSNGKIVARTKYSHSRRGNEQISDNLLSLIAKQMHCSNKTLKGLLGKQFNRQDYLNELLENGSIDQADFDSLMQ
jgi:hypothetical protein